MMLKVRNKIAGFTLAEVLITLSIIGIIAALTIPSLIQNLQDQQYKVVAKKTYASIEQVTRTIMMNNGGTMLGYASWHTGTRDAYLKYMPYVKKCESYSSSGGSYCGQNYCDYFNTNHGTMGGCDGTGGGFTVLNNGVFLLFFAGGGVGDPSTCNPFCTKIILDVNGFNGPNQYGKDMFYILVMPDRLAPNSALTQLLKS